MHILSLLLFVVYVLAAYNTPQNKAWNVNMNTQFKPQEYYGEWKGHKYYPSPKDWRSESVYQFITDRFGDGDPNNNDGRYGGYDLYQVGGRHGGDFKGVAKKMDYIKALGYTAIWISPIFQNQFNSYHGYAQIDFTLLDDRFGTLEEFRYMVEEAHKRDIKVIVDIVVNHMADLFYFEGHEHDAAPFRLHTGEYKFLPRDTNNIYADFIVNNTYYAHGQYCDLYGYDGEIYKDSGSGSFWESDFHHNGDLREYSDVYQNHLGKIYGIMDDLRTTHPRVQNKIIAMTKSLIASTDIDGIRMDTPMQVPLYFFQRWTPAIRDFAKSLGKDNFLIFGEFFCPRERAATMVGRGKTPQMWGKNQFISDDRTFDSGLHYPVFWWFEEAIKKYDSHSLGGLKDLYDTDQNIYDFYNVARNSSEYRHLIFFNNHDQWRMSSTQDGFNRTDLSAAIISLWPGIPAFYYGDEQGFLTKGTALDGWSREDFPTSLAWRDLPTVEGHNPAEFDNFDQTNPHFLWNQRLMNLRRSYKNLQTCDKVDERWKQSGGTNGVYAFSRTCGNQDDWVLVAWNTWRESLSAGPMITGWNAGDTIVNVLSDGFSESYTLGDSGKLPLHLPGFSVKVFVKKQAVKPLDPAVYRINPKHDAVVARDHQVFIVFNSDMAMDTVKNNVQLNGKNVNVTIQDSKVVTFKADGREGINFITIDNVKSTSGLPILAKFISRFRVGQQDNVLINPKFTYDSNMIRVDGNVAIIRHKAVGAELMRYQVEGAKWSNWVVFANESRVQIEASMKGKKITCQYWVDNSAAYYVTGTI
jgi:glycosidase